LASNIAQFPVGMPVVFTTSQNGFLAGQAYFVLTNDAVNTITVALTSTYGSAVTATGNVAINITTGGFSALEICGLDSSSYNTGIDNYGIDCEGVCTVRVLQQLSKECSVSS